MGTRLYTQWGVEGLMMAPLKAQVDTLKILLHTPPLQEPEVPGRLLLL